MTPPYAHTRHSLIHLYMRTNKNVSIIQLRHCIVLPFHSSRPSVTLQYIAFLCLNAVLSQINCRFQTQERPVIIKIDVHRWVRVSLLFFVNIPTEGVIEKIKVKIPAQWKGKLAPLSWRGCWRLDPGRLYIMTIKHDATSVICQNIKCHSENTNSMFKWHILCFYINL